MIKDDTVKILDLGSARYITETGEYRDKDMEVGLGVPEYSAPEQ